MTKIIAGKFKGRVIPTSKNAEYRPSTSKFREAIFSILSSGDFSDANIIPNSNILDLYSGSGALAFESLSRGAKFVTMIDINSEYLKSSKEFAIKLGIPENQISFLSCSAKILPNSLRKYSLVFMDPPYGKDYVSITLKSLHEKKWLSDNAYLVIESEINDNFTFSENFTHILKKKYGRSNLTILKYIENYV